jgi:hypothetical protein
MQQCRNITHLTYKNSETSHTLRAKMTKRPTLYKPQRQNALFFESYHLPYTVKLGYNVMKGTEYFVML